MRIICRECGGKSSIQKTNRISVDYSELYLSCNNPECGHTFVWKGGYSHTLSPSAKTSTQLAIDLLKALPPNQRQELRQQLNLL